MQKYSVKFLQTETNNTSKPKHTNSNLLQTNRQYQNNGGIIEAILLKSGLDKHVPDT